MTTHVTGHMIWLTGTIGNSRCAITRGIWAPLSLLFQAKFVESIFQTLSFWQGVHWIVRVTGNFLYNVQELGQLKIAAFQCGVCLQQDQTITSTMGNVYK